MRGFNTKKAQSCKDGGLIRGPGTGTSDSIPRGFKPGTFIMPADSTKAIGPEVLENISKVPTKVSNGEFAHTPQEVHAVGINTLRTMKDATHSPKEAGVYFANGGAVQERGAKGFALGGEVTNDVTRIGNSYSGGNVGGSITVNGAAPRGFTSNLPGVPGAPNAAVQALPGAMPSPGAPTSLSTVPAAPVNSLTDRNNAVSASSITRTGLAPSPTPAQPAPIPGAVTPITPGAQPVAAQVTPQKPVDSFTARNNAVSASSITNNGGRFDRNGQQFASGGEVRGFKPEPQRLAGGDKVLTEEERQRQVFGSRGLDGLRDMIPKMQAMGYEQNPVQVAQSGRVNSPSAKSTDTDQALAALRRARDAQPVGSPNIAAIDQSIDQRNQSIGGAASALSAVAAPFQKPVQTVAPNPTDMRLSANTQATPMESQAPEVMTDVQRGGATPAVQSPSLSQQAAQPAPAQPVAQALAQVPSLAPVQAQGFQAPTVRHSGNDWQARNDLRSARVSASSIMNRPEWQSSGMGRFRGGQQQGPSESTMAYQAALAQDAAARGQEIAGNQQAMVQGQSNAREAMQQTGANQRAGMGFQTAQQRLAMDQETQGFANRAAQQSEQLRNTLLDPNATPEQRKQAQEALMTLQGKSANGEWGVQVTPATKNVDGSTTAGSIVKYNKRTGETATVGEAGQGAAQAIPQGAVELLKKDPKNAAEFDRKYGAGAAARAMSGK